MILRYESSAILCHSLSNKAVKMPRLKERALLCTTRLILGATWILVAGCEDAPKPPAATTPDLASTPAPAATPPPEPSQPPELIVSLDDAKPLEATPLSLQRDALLTLKDTAKQPQALRLPADYKAAIPLITLFDQNIAIIKPLALERRDFTLIDLKQGKPLRTIQGQFLAASDKQGWFAYRESQTSAQVIVEQLHDPSQRRTLTLSAESTLHEQTLAQLRAAADERLWFLTTDKETRRPVFGSWAADDKDATIKLSPAPVEELWRVQSFYSEGTELYLELTQGVGLREQHCQRAKVSPPHEVACLSQASQDQWRFEGPLTQAPQLRSPSGALVSWRAPEGCLVDVHAHTRSPASVLMRCLSPEGKATPGPWRLWTPNAMFSLGESSKTPVQRAEHLSTVFVARDEVWEISKPARYSSPIPIRALDPKSTPRQALVASSPKEGAQELWRLDTDTAQLRLLATYEDCPTPIQQDGMHGSRFIISCRQAPSARSALKQYWTEYLDLEQGLRYRFGEGFFTEAFGERGQLLLSDRAQHLDQKVTKLWRWPKP